MKPSHWILGRLPQVLLVLGALALSGCGESSQALDAGSGIKAGPAAYVGVGNSPFAESGWKAGDKAAWEQQLKSRAQYGQNDYTRMGGH